MTSQSQDRINEDLLLAIIKKGGSVPKQEPATIDEQKMSPSQFKAHYQEIKKLELRLPRWLIKRIDDIASQYSPAYMSRHNWIVDAILNKLVTDKCESTEIK